MQGGACLGRRFQPYESHIPFLLQLKVGKWCCRFAVQLLNVAVAALGMAASLPHPSLLFVPWRHCSAARRKLGPALCIICNSLLTSAYILGYFKHPRSTSTSWAWAT